LRPGVPTSLAGREAAAGDPLSPHPKKEGH
jgi:hypothetical protein